MKFPFKTFPLRQRILLWLTVFAGAGIFLCSVTNAFSPAVINLMIFIYSIAVPLLLLSFPTVIDLNESRIFIAWFCISIILLAIGMLTNSMGQFHEPLSVHNPHLSGIDRFIADYSTSSLKSLFAFLVIYWLLNKALLHFTGNCIVNTLRQDKWYNEQANRKINEVDAFLNIFLIMVIAVAALFGK